jgi:hypothetical protein
MQVLGVGFQLKCAPLPAGEEHVAAKCRRSPWLGNLVVPCFGKLEVQQAGAVYVAMHTALLLQAAEVHGLLAPLMLARVKRTMVVLLWLR